MNNYIVECKCFGNEGTGRYKFMMSLQAKDLGEAREIATLVTKEYVAIEDVREVNL